MLGGTLSLKVISDFLLSAPGNSTFTVVTSTGLTGAFSNVGNGQRLLSLDGGASFQVNYGAGSAFAANSVVLSSFIAIPEPSTHALIFTGLAWLGITARRRRSRR